VDRPIQIAVCGSGEVDPDSLRLAEAVGREIAGVGATLVCGGRGGVMAAAARGARAGGGEAIGIVPGHDPREAAPECTRVVATGIGQARNLAVALSGDALIAIGGGWGTLSEIALARRFGRPVVSLRSWRPGPPPAGGEEGVEHAADAEGAVRIALAAAARSS
jgi:uncharacterized protein (TIGR00725 family)